VVTSDTKTHPAQQAAVILWSLLVPLWARRATASGSGHRPTSDGARGRGRWGSTIQPCDNQRPNLIICLNCSSFSVNNFVGSPLSKARVKSCEAACSTVACGCPLIRSRRTTTCPFSKSKMIPSMPSGEAIPSRFCKICITILLSFTPIARVTFIVKGAARRGVSYQNLRGIWGSRWGNPWCPA
jgi:hypothetical protein